MNLCCCYFCCLEFKLIVKVQIKSFFRYIANKWEIVQIVKTLKNLTKIQKLTWRKKEGCKRIYSITLPNLLLLINNLA